MAVYKKTYRPYEGRLTDPRWRFFVLTRYALADMHGRRFFSLFFLASMINPLVCALIIYLHHNLSALQTMPVDPRELLPINTTFFMAYLGIQCMFVFFLNAFIGPGLISPDVANNALPLYLARPFSRHEYILGELSVILVLFSAITWVPGLLLFLLQSFLEGGAWMADNARIAFGLFFGSLVWILLLGLLALAVSAWVKWKPIAGAIIFGVFFIVGGFGNAINEILRTKWGNLISVNHLIGSVWIALFRDPARQDAGATFFHVSPSQATPLWTSWLALIAIWLFCLYVLSKKVRGAEVIR